MFFFDFVQAVTDPIMALFCAGDGGGGGSTRPFRAQMSANIIHRRLGHQAEGGPFAAGNREETGDPFPLFVV